MQEEQKRAASSHRPVRRKSLFPELSIGAQPLSSPTATVEPSQPESPETIPEPSQPKTPKTHEKPKKKSRTQVLPVFFTRQKIKYVALITAGVLIAAAGGYALVSARQSKTEKDQAKTLAAESEKSLPLYYPVNLPTGYTLNNDSKELKTDVFYFSITGPKKELYYVTQQLIPANFDFVAFNKKFLNPDTFTAASGTVTVGAVGANMLGSIRTSKNTWIIINASETATLVTLETVARSLN